MCTLVSVLWASGVMTCVAQTSDQDYPARARELFLTVERTARLPTPQQDLETAQIYRDVWPVLEREMLTAMAYNAAAAPNAVESKALQSHIITRALAWQ